ncbi:MAG: DUF1553 domain-containing protein, partial [Planctomycetota bacterium]
QKSIPSSLITATVEPREIRVLPRGNWMDDSGAVVAPAVPAFLDAIKTDERLTRLELAKWLVSDRNPLGARVFVNRVWAMLFGRGIAGTLEDLGSQGDWPTHPELLDHLAYGFQSDGGDVKRLIRSIVMSRTYRQSSAMTPELRELDPDNELLARQNIRRLDAEMVRDNALSLSALLVKKIGGPSVRPYQPVGYYAHLNFPKRVYKKSEGSDQFRRGLYTHWQRQFLHPAMKAFDAPSREVCTAQRTSSNTPMASLVLLNDPTSVEAARHLASLIDQRKGRFETRLNWAARRVLSRDLRPQETKVFRDLYDRHLAEYRGDPSAAAELLSVGDSESSQSAEGDAGADAERAAWTSLARAMLNLHETITRY